jgi:hypothetical protein
VINLCRSLKTGIAAAIIGLASLCILSPAVYAIEPHQDPETAEPVYSAISLLRYYSAALDYVLQKNPAQVEARLEKMPFANIPRSLEAAAGDFASSGVDLSHLVVDIEDGLSRWQTLIVQSRFDEADELAEQVLATISRAHIELDNIEEATEATDRELHASLAPAGSDLRLAYEGVMQRIGHIRDMLDLYARLLGEVLPKSVITEEFSEFAGITLEEYLRIKGLTVDDISRLTGISVEVLSQLAGVTVEELLRPTEITLKVEPVVIFVGGNVSLEGRLTGEAGPLAGREVVILLNSSPYMTVLTDNEGYYREMLAVPYWYVSELDIRALYYPRDEDIGHYLASLSRVVTIEVLFYQAGLEITLEDMAYPGRETTVAGKFEYGQSPPLAKREVEIYFDNVLVSEISVSGEFEQPIGIAPETDLGRHIIMVSSAAVGRHAPVVNSAVIEVIRATPVLDLSLPAVALIPGSVALDGRLYSEVGPLNGALVKIGLGESRIDLASTESGALDGEIRVGMGFGVIGRQDMVVQVLPREPWHRPLVTTRSLLMVNVVNCGGIIVILALFSILLPVVLRRRLRTYTEAPVAPVVAITPYRPAPAYSQEVTLPVIKRPGVQDRGQPRNVILAWYRFVVGVIRVVTRVMLKPQQTLREFASESHRILGPAAKYFLELTKMVERLLYSRYQPTAEDAGESRKLSRNIEEELKGEGV